MTDLKNLLPSELAAPQVESSSEDDNCSLSSDEEQKPGAEDTTCVRRRSSLHNLRFRAQKHLVGRMVKSRQSIKPLIGKRAYAALKQFEQLLKAHMDNQKEAKAVINAVVKTIGKLGVVAKQNTLTDNQLALARRSKDQFYTTALTIISFVRTDYTYNQPHLVQLLRDCEQTVCKCVLETLSAKSVGRINLVFETLCDKKLMDNVFSLNATPDKRKILLDLTDSLDALVSVRSST